MEQKLSRSARRAMEKYGLPACIEAYQRHARMGEGAATVAATLRGVRTTRQADAAINAGREWARINERS